MSQYPDSWRKIQQQFAQRGGNNFSGPAPKRAVGLGLGALLVGGAVVVISNALFNGLFVSLLDHQKKGKILLFEFGWALIGSILQWMADVERSSIPDSKGLGPKFIPKEPISESPGSKLQSSMTSEPSLAMWLP